jgi:hypothetical protein
MQRGRAAPVRDHQGRREPDVPRWRRHDRLGRADVFPRDAGSPRWAGQSAS